MNKNSGKKAEVNGKSLICPICSNDRFKIKSAQLNTAISTFFNLDWTNQSATCMVCTACTHITWFLNPPLKQ